MMKRTTRNKSVQTNPVIILPIDTRLTKKENISPLENQQDDNNEATKYSTTDKMYDKPSQSLEPHQKPQPSVTYANIDDSPYALPERDIKNEQSTDYVTKIEDESYESISEPIKKSLAVFSPIYILKEPLNYDVDKWETGDEFELISHVHNNSNMLRLKHLRTSTIKDMDQSFVELDKNTPLRLSKQSRGTIECFLLKSDVRYCFLIHRSDQDENVYILRVNQHQKTKEALISHYFIRINKENNCFYLEHEKKLLHCFFPTFQQLVNNAKVHKFIPLSKPVDRNLSMNENELWQIDYKQLIIGKNIGAGEFGEVMSGKWKRNGPFDSVEVAIKRLKLNDVTSNDFVKEIQTMKRLRNKYLVLLLGVSIDPITNEKLMITEFMVDGDLKNWLWKQITLPSNDILINYCHQICLGMSYLERNNYVHRDLACRNILLRGSEAKIADFGMAVIGEEDPYYTVFKSKQSIGKVAYRWTGPEIFDGNAFTTRSDVWSFGICLIEIWSKGGLPYPSLKHLSEVKQKIKEGYVHDKPPQCSKTYYRIIKRCLKTNPDDRPPFAKLTDLFKDLLMNDKKLKTNSDVVSYNNIKGKKSYTDTKSQAFPSNQVVDTVKKQTTPTKKVPNDTYSFYDTISPIKYETSSLDPNNHYSSNFVSDDVEKDSRTSSVHLTNPPTNNNVSIIKDHNYEEADSQKKTDEHGISCDF